MRWKENEHLRSSKSKKTQVLHQGLLIVEQTFSLLWQHVFGLLHILSVVVFIFLLSILFSLSQSLKKYKERMKNKKKSGICRSVPGHSPQSSTALLEDLALKQRLIVAVCVSRSHRFTVSPFILTRCIYCAISNAQAKPCVASIGWSGLLQICQFRVEVRLKH